MLLAQSNAESLENCCMQVLLQAFSRTREGKKEKICGETDRESEKMCVCVCVCLGFSLRERIETVLHLIF